MIGMIEAPACRVFMCAQPAHKDGKCKGHITNKAPESFRCEETEGHCQRQDCYDHGCLKAIK